MAPTQLATEVAALHAYCLDILATTDAGAPSLEYVSPGEAALDCDCDGNGQLTTWVQGLGEAPTSPQGPTDVLQRARFRAQPMVTIQVLVARCLSIAEGANLLPPDEMSLAAIEVQDDAWAIWNGVMRAVEREELFAKCSPFQRVSAVPLPVQGGCIGWVITFSVNIPGYAPIPEGT